MGHFSFINKSIFFLLLLLLPSLAQASYELPKGLDKVDQKKALNIIAFSTAHKEASNPYPLGGYSGVEVGLAVNLISTDELSSLGTQSSSNSDISYFTLSVSKGLYHNIDVGFYFTPFFQELKLRTYGGNFNWGFFESKSFPLILSLSLFGGGANFDNLVNVTTIGGDLIATVAMDNLAVYGGAGQVRGNGTFIGGTAGITADGTTGTQDSTSGHILFGMSVSYEKFFLALQVDRYFESSYTGKIGYRF